VVHMRNNCYVSYILHIFVIRPQCAKIKSAAKLQKKIRMCK
jgi:hypothetical protein